MKWISKNLLFVIVTFLILVFASSFTYLANAENGWDIKINTISGDYSVLKNINIEGTLLDHKMALQFYIHNGQTTQNLIKQQKAVNSLYIVNGEHTWDRLTADKAQYEINFMNNSGMNISITRRLFDKNYYTASYDRVDLVTGFRSNNSNDINTQIIDPTNSSTNSATNSAEVTEEHGITINVNPNVTTMQVLEGKLYFIIPKLKDFTGNSGLYVVDKFERNNPNVGVRKLAEIPLTGGEEEMVALGKVDNKLCLVRKNPGKVSIQIFDIEKQAFEAEFSDNIIADNEAQNVKQNTVSEESSNPKNQNDKQHNEQLYAIYSSPEHMSIVINGENGFDIYTYGFASKVGRVSTVKGYKGDDGMRQFSLFFTNNYLYIIQNEIVWPEKKYENQQYRQNPNELIYIIAYNTSGEMAFKGELDAGQKDDNIRQLKFSEKLEEDNKYGLPYRRFAKIKLSTLPEASTK